MRAICWNQYASIFWMTLVKHMMRSQIYPISFTRHRNGAICIRASTPRNRSSKSCLAALALSRGLLLSEMKSVMHTESLRHVTIDQTSVMQCSQSVPQRRSQTLCTPRIWTEQKKPPNHRHQVDGLTPPLSHSVCAVHVTMLGSGSLLSRQMRLKDKRNPKCIIVRCVCRSLADMWADEQELDINQ